MADTIWLRSCIEHKGVKLGHVAAVLGISYSTLRSKLNNEREFKLSEVDKLCSLLQLTPAQRDQCFFPPFH